MSVRFAGAPDRRLARRDRGRAGRRTATGAGSFSRPITPRNTGRRHRRPVRAGQPFRVCRPARSGDCTCSSAGRRASWFERSRERSSTSPSTSGAARRRSAAGSASRSRRTTSGSATCRPASPTAFVSSARRRRSNTSAPTSTIRRSRSASPGTIRRWELPGRSASRSCQNGTGATRVWTSFSTFCRVGAGNGRDRSVAATNTLAGDWRLRPVEASFDREHAPDGHAACRSRTVADLISALSRECWGRQSVEAEGHYSDAMPFYVCSGDGTRFDEDRHQR